MQFSVALGRRIDQRYVSLLRLAVVAAAGLCGLLLVVLLLRRAAGAFDQPLRGDVIGGVALAAVATAGLWRLVFLAAFPCREREYLAVILLLPGFYLVLLSVGLSLPGSPLWSLVMLWFLVLAGEACWWLGFVLQVRDRGARRAPGPSRPASRRETDHADAAEDEPHDDAPALAEQHVTQQWTRAEDVTGDESLHAVLRERFEPGERLRQIHVAICPPLAESPEVEVYQREGPEATIKVAQRERFGLRFEVRLAARSASEQWITLEFVAHGRQLEDRRTR